MLVTSKGGRGQDTDTSIATHCTNDSRQLEKTNTHPWEWCEQTETENGTESIRKSCAEKDVILSNCAIFLRRLSDKIMAQNLPLKCQNGLDICIILTILPEPSIRVSRPHAINKLLNLIFSKTFSLSLDKKSCYQNTAHVTLCNVCRSQEEVCFVKFIL